MCTKTVCYEDVLTCVQLKCYKKETKLCLPWGIPLLPLCNTEMIMLMSCLLITHFTVSLLKCSSSYKVMLCGQVTSAEWTCEVVSARVYITWDLLAATTTASAFDLIGPAVCYVRIHTQPKYVHQNCVLWRCANLCSIEVLQKETKHAISLHAQHITPIKWPIGLTPFNTKQLK